MILGLLRVSITFLASIIALCSISLRAITALSFPRLGGSRLWIIDSMRHAHIPARSGGQCHERQGLPPTDTNDFPSPAGLPGANSTSLCDTRRVSASGRSWSRRGCRCSLGSTWKMRHRSIGRARRQLSNAGTSAEQPRDRLFMHFAATGEEDDVVGAVPVLDEVLPVWP
jgi:hypothetical protein